MTTVSVAIPVRNGGEQLGEVLAAVAAQRIDAEVEVVVLDSGSFDGSRRLAVRHGARVEGSRQSASATVSHAIG